LRGFSRFFGGSGPTLTLSSALIASLLAVPVAGVPLDDVAAETLTDSSESTFEIPLPKNSEPLAIPLAKDPDAFTATVQVALNDVAAPSVQAARPSPAAFGNMLPPLTLAVVTPLLSPAVDAVDRLSPVEFSVDLGNMRLEEFSPDDNASLDAYGLTIEEVSQIVEVKQGDTLIELLVDAGATQEDAYAAVTALEPAFSPRELKPGQAIELTFASAQTATVRTEAVAVQLVGLQIQPDAERDVAVNRSFDGLFTVMEIEHPLQLTTVRGSGTIDTSLYEAALDAGVSITALTEMIRAFSFDVDFQREIQPGDSFEIVYDHYLDENGEVVKTGEVVYASMTLSGETLELYRFTPSSGIWDFFNPNGESVRKALMRTPIDGARLTSGFGMRTHPTLGYTKMHRGVDFGAPTGTPIYAAGDGVIEKIGPFSSYGNYIRIRHNSEYSTAYAHMNGFAKGLSQGDRVRQGDIIGYVGTTGRSTGPHLHYEVLVAGEQVNPLDIKLPAGEKLAGADLEAYFAARDELIALRDTLRRGEALLAQTQGTCYSVAEERSCEQP
jgi:murein DD-endopeptidase MepM/ murein hydrolase activator NlpD